MTAESKSLIQEELSHSGEESPITPELITLDTFRITTETEVPEEEYLFRLFDKPCFPRRDISAITGAEKCGKTLFTTMLMACCIKKEVLELERINEEALKIMWYDTEQSTSTTKGILSDRIAKMVDGELDTHFFVFNVRPCDYEERLEMLITGIESYHPDLVIIDNISDLLPSINDGEASVKLVDQLMQLSSEHNCNISVVIHLNKSGEKRNLRGWLGTEILHKAFEVYHCEQIYGTEVFSIEQTLSRKYRVSQIIYYTIDNEGLPCLVNKPDTQPRDAQGKFMSTKPEAYQMSADKMKTFNQDYILRHLGDNRHPWEWNLQQLFGDAMGSRAMMGCEDLKKTVMQLAKIKRPGYYEKVFDLARQQGVVKQTLDKNGRVVVITP